MLLSQIGIEPERLRMYMLSSAMANEFVNAVQETVNIINDLGPNPLRNLRGIR